MARKDKEGLKNCQRLRRLREQNAVWDPGPWNVKKRISRKIGEIIFKNLYYS